MEINIQLVEDIIQYPHLLGNILGFTKLDFLHSDWIHYIYSNEKNVSLQAHRGGYKSTAIRVGMPWYMVFNPNDRICYMRENFTKAAEVINSVASIMRKPFIRELYKYIQGRYPTFKIAKYGKLTFDFKKTDTPEGNLEAVGLENSATGSHYDRIIVDDAITIQDRISKTKREKTKLYLREYMTNIVDPGKPISFVGTPWHKDDAWTILPEPLKFDCFQTGVLTEKEIEEKKKTTTPSQFSANYLLKHQSDEDQLFTDAKFGHWDFKLPAYGHLDAAFDGDHYNALTIMAHDKTLNKYNVLGLCYPGNVKDWIEDIVKFCQRYRVKMLWNEDNPDKGYSADKLRAKGLNVTTYSETQNKHFKISTYLYDKWAKIEFDPNTDPDYLAQIIDYRKGEEPDDAPDSLASLIREKFYSGTVNRSLYSA